MTKKKQIEALKETIKWFKKQIKPRINNVIGVTGEPFGSDARYQ